jgi:diacylglycerol kinase family enzyme
MGVRHVRGQAFMRVAILVNPASGAGRAGEAARHFARSIRDAGHDVVVAETRPGSSPPGLEALVDGAAVVVAVGGDGTMRAAAAAAIPAGTPLYHLPLGTVNLFAREFGMDRRPATLLAALRAAVVRRVDAGDADGETFLLMASMGLDAEVVHEIARRRGAGLSRAAYLWPMLRQAALWDPPRMTLTVDGERIVTDEPGLVVVANSRHYMWGFDPARRADMTDGFLDVVFFPVGGRAQLLRWALRCLMRRHLRDRRLIYRLGRRVEVECRSPQRFQLDGDPADSRRRLCASVLPGALAVLVPPRS